MATALIEDQVWEGFTRVYVTKNKKNRSMLYRNGIVFIHLLLTIKI